MPVLLLRGKGLVKSVKFKDHRYIGDPLNAARIYNEARADELIFLDIDATREGRLISLDFVSAVAEEVSIPFSVGGGVRTLDDIRSIVRCGVEKVVICSQAVIEPDFVRRAAAEFGSSTISVCIDVKNDLLGRGRVVSNAGTKNGGSNPVEFAQLMAANGAGEIILQSIRNDGAMQGYDLELTASVSRSVGIPVVALGGAGSSNDVSSVLESGIASAAAAGSMFVYHGKHRGVLINYQRESIRASHVEPLYQAVAA